MYRAATFCRPSLRVSVSAPFPRRQILFAPSSTINTTVRTFRAVPQVPAAGTSVTRATNTSVSAKPIPHLRTSKAPGVKTTKRNCTTQSPVVEGGEPLEHGMLYFDNAYPLKMGWWDFRYPIMKPGWRSLERKAKTELVPPEADMPFSFKVGGIEPRLKDGGMYVHFSYTRPASYTTREALKEIENRCEQHLVSHNHYMWFNLQKVRAFLVKGTPFLEDMASRYPNKKIRIEFTGDLNVEGLYAIFRKYGKIIDITMLPQVGNAPKQAVVQFSKMRASTSAKSCLHGAEVHGVQMNVTYEKSLQGNIVMAWVSDHAKFIVPAVVVAIAGLSFVLFDPIREFSMYAKVTQMFSVDEYRFLRWLRKETVGRLTRASTEPLPAKGWHEREVDEAKLRNWLHVPPETFAIVYGARGSGKTQMVKHAISDKNNKVVIDCEELANARSESEVLSSLATQIGYYPLFQFIPTMINMLDVAVAAATSGQKSGLAPSFSGQLQKILDSLTVALQEASPTKGMSNSSVDLILKRIEATIEEKARHAILHTDEKTYRAIRAARKRKERDIAAGWCDPDEIPVVVIDGFMCKEKGEHAKVLWAHLAEWAAILVENHVAHVIFVTDNVVAAKPLAKALPNMTIETIMLSDATLESALEFVYKHLDKEEYPDLDKPIQTIGGRLTDLELFVQKIKSGMKPEDAVLDILARAVIEVRKGAFDFDSADDRILGWTPLQFWTLMKRLSSGEPAHFDELRVHPLFKNEEAPFGALEQAELISIVHKNGRPFAVRPGKPIYTAAFQNILEDVGFSAVMEIESASRLQKEEMANVAKWEAELKDLASLLKNDGSWMFGGGRVPKEIDTRVKWLMAKLADSHAKVEKYEQDIAAARKAIATLTAA
ncbi:mitochondrial escape protein 2 [Mortierella sp. AD094]|nr:mitochondrial escape protein 2 [Mortierella sp. AD094]